MMLTSLLSRLARAWRTVFRRHQSDREVADEVQAYVDLLADVHERSGLSASSARRQAQIDVGGVEAVKTSLRLTRPGALLSDIGLDVRYACRRLVTKPIFTLTAAGSLAVGVSAVTAVFAVANSLLLRPAEGVANAGRVVDIAATPREILSGITPLSLDHLEMIRGQATTLTGVYGYTLEPSVMSFRAADQTERVYGSFVTTNYFSVLEVSPALGRVLSPVTDDTAGGAVAVLSYDFWSRRLNADPTLIGRSVWVNSRVVTIVGVASVEFRGTALTAADLWLPVEAGRATSGNDAAAIAADHRRPWLFLGGRLRVGADTTTATTEIQRIADVANAAGRRAGALRWSVLPTSPVPVGLRALVASFLVLLAVLTLLVLLIATANVGAMVLAASVARRREIGVRTAIGSSPGRIVRLLVTETVLLFCVGGVAGVGLSRGWVAALLHLLPSATVPVHLAVPVDWRVVIFALSISLLAGLGAGLMPARHASRSDVLKALREQVSAGAESRRLRNLFVVLQITVSTILLVLVGLLVHRVRSTSTLNQGFDARGIVTVPIDWSTAGRTPADAGEASSRLMEEIRRLPGVESVAAADASPAAPGRRRSGQRLRDSNAPDADEDSSSPLASLDWHIVTPGYFKTLSMRLDRGRDFTADDRRGATPVAIISAALARREWPGQPPLGQQLTVQMPPGATAQPSAVGRVTVVGVVSDLDTRSSGRATATDIYVPLDQAPLTSITILVRAAAVAQVIPNIRNLVAAGAPSVAPPEIQPLKVVQAGPVEFQLRIATIVTSILGVMGLVLALGGVYGVTTYVVTERQREFGTRLALGATRRQIVLLALRRGMALVAIGVPIGLLLGALLVRITATSPLGPVPLHPLVFGAAAIFLVGAGFAANYIPARRAADIDPLTLLRAE